MRFGDAAVFVDDVGDAAGVFVAGARGGTVGQADPAVRVTQQWEGKPELTGEAGVLLSGVETRAEDLRVLRGVLIVEVPEPGTLEGSARCVGLRKEPEHDSLAAQIAEADLAAGVVADLELGRDVANLQH